MAFAEILGGSSGEEQVRAADFDVIPSIAGARLSHLQTAMMQCRCKHNPLHVARIVIRSAQKKDLYP